MLNENYLILPPRARERPNPQETLRTLPPSAKLVWRTLDQSGALTSHELSRETLLAPRTVRHALKRLQQFGLVNARTSLRDCRSSYFYLGERCERV